MNKAKGPSRPGDGSSYEVGYGRPPVASRFQAGNRAAAGRRTKYDDHRNIFSRLMLERRKGVLNGRTVTLPIFEWHIRNLSAKAMQGEPKSVNLLFKYWDILDFKPPHEVDHRDYGAEFRAKIRAIAERIQSSGESEDAEAPKRRDE